MLPPIGLGGAPNRIRLVLGVVAGSGPAGFLRVLVLRHRRQVH